MFGSAGVGALLKQIDHSVTPYELKNLLKETAKNIEFVKWNSYYGSGIIQPQKAIKQLKQNIHSKT